MFILLVFALVVFAASLLGGLVLVAFPLTHTRMQGIISLVAGLMLGVALLHLLPLGSLLTHHSVWSYGFCLLGLLAMFFLIRIFEFHQHPEGQDEHSIHDHAHGHCDHDHASPHDHSHDRPALQTIGGSPPDKSQLPDSHGDEREIPIKSSLMSHSTRWYGLIIGLAIHSLLDGFAMAAAIQGESTHDWVIPVGAVGILIALSLHKALDSLMLTSLMIAGKQEQSMIWFANVLFAAVCPIGAMAFYLGSESFGSNEQFVLGATLAFSAGVFLCISLGDLLPELHFHSHDRLKLSLMLLVGVALSVTFELLPGHQHPDPVNASETSEELSNPSAVE
jgi:zinc and cadmium transporter